MIRTTSLTRHFYRRRYRYEAVEGMSLGLQESWNDFPHLAFVAVTQLKRFSIGRAITQGELERRYTYRAISKFNPHESNVP